ncbi:MAG: hypothetical protein FD138_3465 [Planctomycetota bacterium]|nr:MAG: hypothetical protein FD138_3465 [Planctomycetota bacterium]
MSTHGDQKPPHSGDSSKKPSDDDFVDKTLPEGAFDQTLSEDVIESTPPESSFDKTLPEGAFDRTLPEGAFDDADATDDSATMIGDEPAAPDEGATMLSDDGGVPDECATMLSDDGGVPPAEDEYGKTLPDGVLAESNADEDFAGKTMMMDSATGDEGAGAEDDYSKTMPASALEESQDDADDADKTMVAIESASSPSDSGDDFGKTIQVDSFSATMTDDGDTLPQEDFDGKTIVGSDSGVGQDVPPSKPIPVLPPGRTMAGPGAKPSGGTMFTSQATRAGGLTSVGSKRTISTSRFDKSPG